MRIVESQVALAASRQASVTDFTRTTTEAWTGARPAHGAITTTTPGLSGRDAQTVTSGLSTAAALRQAGPAAVASLSAASSAGQLRLAARTALAQSAGLSSAQEPSADDPTMSDPKLSILALLVEALTGHKIHLIDPSAVRTDADAAAQQAGQAAAQAATQSAAQAAPPASGSGSPAPAQPAGWGVDVQVEQVHHETETTGFEAAWTSVFALAVKSRCIWSW
jgi:Na+-translocating ferredoxin:NAD+ oxidoreductase subunit C